MRACPLWALVVLCGSLGCAHLGELPWTSSGQNTADSREDSSHRQPRAATCIAYANLSEQAAADPRCTPSKSEQLRDQARKAYQQALRIEPGNLTALTGLARLYIAMDDQAHAIATYEKALQTHPREAALWYELGMCHARRKDLDSAVKNLRQAVDLDPEQRLYVHSLGFCLARAGRYDDSFAVFARLEGEASANYNLARMLHHLQQDELSKQHAQMALTLKPDLEPARQLLAALANPAIPAPAPDIVPTATTLPVEPASPPSPARTVRSAPQVAAYEFPIFVPPCP
jgi:tetratricopeptide (TPR) repeat protein